MNTLRVVVLGSLGLILLSGAAVAAQSELTPSGPVATRFGSSLALDGGKLAIGAPGANESGPSPGAVYVFEVTPAGWRQTLTIHAPHGRGDVQFGRRVALAGADLVVADPVAPNPNPGAGIAYGFRIDRPKSLPEGFGPADPGIGVGFGGAIAADRDTLVIGAPGLETATGRSGGVFVYERTAAGWRLVQRLRAPDIGGRVGYGFAVALAGDHLAVAAPAMAGSGAVFVYERRPEVGWQLVQTLGRPADRDSGSFGSSLAMTSEWLAAASGSETGPGAVHLYRRGDAAGGKWRLSATAHSGAPQSGGRFGEAIAVTGDLLAVGAPAEDAMGTSTGAVHLFRLAADAPPRWLRRLAIPSRHGNDEFGRAILMAEGRLVVGAPGREGDRGMVVTYPLGPLQQPPSLAFEIVAHPGEGLGSAVINAIEVDAQGYLLLGTYKGGVDVYDGEASRPHVAGDAAEGRLGNGGVLALLTDRRGDYWVGTEDGLYRFDRGADTFHRAGLGSGLGPEPVVAIHEASDGTLWVGSNGELFRRGPGDAGFQRFVAFSGTPQVLDETYISGIQEARDGAIWVLAKNLFENRASLYRVRRPSGSVQRFPLASSWGQVGPLLVDGEDRLWIKAPRPVPLPQKAGTSVQPDEPIVPDSVWSMLEASDGSVWLGTMGGIYLAEPGEDVARHVRVAPLLSPGRPWDWIRSFHELAPGVMLVGTGWGLFAATYRHAGDRIPASPHLVVSSLEISGPDGTRSVGTYGLRAIELSAADTSFTLQVSTLDYARSGDRRYRYRLDPLDPNWVETGARRVISFSNIPPGRYRLRVESRGLGPGPAGRLEMPVRVLPQWWQTWWFRSLAVLLVIGLGVAAYQTRTRRLVGLERMRLRIADDLHDDLSTNLSGIALLSERLQAQGRLDAGAQESIGAIAATSRGMLEDLRDLVWIIDPSHDEMGSLIARMRAVAEALFGERCHFVVDESVPLESLGMRRRRELLMIYKEIVHNAARHAGPSLVEISMAGTSGRLALTVADDGVGFDPEASHSGHGLRSIRARAERLGGELRIASRPGKGTRVTLVVDG